MNLQPLRRYSHLDGTWSPGTASRVGVLDRVAALDQLAQVIQGHLHHRRVAQEVAAATGDVGEPAEYANWHIHQAFSLPLRRLSREGGGLPRGCPKVFVSRMGRRGSLAVHMMLDLGFERDYNLKGGMLAWEAAGYPIAVE